MRLEIAAAGDLSFQGTIADSPKTECFSPSYPFFNKADLVIGNLENPLIDCGKPVSNKCVLRGNTGWAEILKKSGVHIVSLANNHMMDFGPDGLQSTMSALGNAGVRFVGAGNNIQEACSPLFYETDGKKLAILARTLVIVASRSYAEEHHPGVAFFDKEETCRSISECRKKADFVILLMHWGIEHYAYPSPIQRQLAKDLIAAGADLILGHHPHVLQGVERIGKGLVFYSLGNFVFDDIPWSFTGRDGVLHHTVAKLKEADRKSVLAQIALDGDAPPGSYKLLPMYIESSGSVRPDDSPVRQAELDRLCSRLSWKGYSLLWRLYSLGMEWKLRIEPQFKGKLSWQYIKKIRFSHFVQLIGTMKRSSKITAGKTTNPYD